MADAKSGKRTGRGGGPTDPRREKKSEQRSGESGVESGSDAPPSAASPTYDLVAAGVCLLGSTDFELVRGFDVVHPREERTDGKPTPRSGGELSGLTAARQPVLAVDRDPLTGLTNRPTFVRRVDQAVARARVEGRSLSLLLFNFAGIGTGRALQPGTLESSIIRGVAGQLQRSFRRPDSVSRAGAKRFAVLLEEVEDKATARTIGERLLGEALQPITGRAEPIRPLRLERTAEREFVSGALRGTMGVALFPEDGDSAIELLRQAGGVLSDRVAVDDKTMIGTEQLPFSAVDDGLRAELAEAADQGDFELAYQPVWSVAEDRFSAAEGLLRWKRKGFPSMSPRTFVPLLEASGEIGRVSLSVFDMACREAARWRGSGLPQRIAVNLSSHQFENRQLVDRLMECLELHSLQPHDLELDVTEAVLDAGPAVRVQLRELQQMGVVIALDDFGTGGSSLSSLDQLPIDVLKIDRSFVAGLAVSDGSRQLVDSIVSVGHGLDLDVVAEGVETEEQKQFLSDSGCDRLQGFLFSRPLTPDAVHNVLQHDFDTAA